MEPTLEALAFTCTGEGVPNLKKKVYILLLVLKNTPVPVTYANECVQVTEIDIKCQE